MSLLDNPEMQILQTERDSHLEWRKRRHPDFTDIYTLYRDKVITDRITQRQTINVPLMKFVIGTILKNLDETPGIYFASRDNDHQKEVYANSYYNESAKRNKSKIKDTIDKKQGALFGRTFKKINRSGIVTWEVVDPQDMLVSRFVDPADLHTAPSIFQTGMYQPLRLILADESYEQEGRDELRRYYTEEKGTLEQDTTFELAQEKAERMEAMGVTDMLDPILGETYVELNEAYRFEDSKLLKNEQVIWRYVIAATPRGFIKLSKREFHDLVGKTSDNYWADHYPYPTWGADPERTDFWCDGPGDIVKPINIVLNTWISQLVENRTLKNFNMKYYDSSNERFVPQVFDPQPWGWYPVPGKPADVVQDVMVGDLSDSLDEIQFLIDMAKEATAATAAQGGATEQKQVTLGEVQLALANASQRIKSSEKYINESWEELGTMFMKMVEAGGDELEDIDITKKGRNSQKLYTKDIGPKDFISSKGYTVEVRTVSDKTTDDLDSLQKLQAATASMPTNQALTDIKNRKLLEFAGLTPEEVNTVLEVEKQKLEQMANMPGMPMLGTPTPQPDIMGQLAAPAPQGMLNA
jgi:hypothetical protein